MNEDMLKEYRVLFNSLSREGIKDNDKFVPNKDYLEQFEYIVYFLVEIEERYGVVFDKEKINNPDFFTLKNISNELLAKRELKNC